MRQEYCDWTVDIVDVVVAVLNEDEAPVHNRMNCWRRTSAECSVLEFPNLFGVYENSYMLHVLDLSLLQSIT